MVEKTILMRLPFISNFVNILFYLKIHLFYSYYLNGENAKIQQLYNYTVYDRFKGAIMNLRQYNMTVPIWAGETSSAYDSGSETLSHSYVGGLLLVDKVGVAAKYGLEMILRQDIFGGNYGVLNEYNYPNPVRDNWLKKRSQYIRAQG